MHKRRFFAAGLVLIFMMAGCRPTSPQAASSPQPSSGMLSTEPLENSGNPVLQMMGTSYAASDFTQGEIPPEDIELILSAGAKAQSAKNAQPWHFAVILKEDLAAHLLEAAQPGNVMIVLSGNPDILTDTMAFDCGMAAQNMQLAAQALGYGARVYIQPVSEIEKNWRDALRIPEGYIVQAAILIGHTAEGPDAVATGTPRRALADTVSWVTG